MVHDREGKQGRDRQMDKLKNRQIDIWTNRSMEKQTSKKRINWQNGNIENRSM